jgi:hypothetical protein
MSQPEPTYPKSYEADDWETSTGETYCCGMGKTKCRVVTTLLVLVIGTGLILASLIAGVYFSLKPISIQVCGRPPYT